MLGPMQKTCNSEISGQLIEPMKIKRASIKWTSKKRRKKSSLSGRELLRHIQKFHSSSHYLFAISLLISTLIYSQLLIASARPELDYQPRYAKDDYNKLLPSSSMEHSNSFNHFTAKRRVVNKRLELERISGHYVGIATPHLQDHLDSSSLGFKYEPGIQDSLEMDHRDQFRFNYEPVRSSVWQTREFLQTMPIPAHLRMASKNNEIASDDVLNEENVIGGGEQGSGFGWMDEAALPPNSPDSVEQNYINPTPVFQDNSNNKQAQSTPTPNQIAPENNRAPQLVQRIPKLTAIAGRVWRYFIPFDTFIDEDGDLRQLKFIVLRLKDKNWQQNGGQDKSNEQESSSGQLDQDEQFESIGQFYSWLQYDQSAQLLYALPTSFNVGKHELVLMVKDQFNVTSSESIEIQVRQHQSIRAFTHSFRLNQVRIDKSRYPSLIDAIGELIKRIGSKVYQDHPFKNMIIKSYEQVKVVASNDSSQESEFIYLDIMWSNASIAVYPCNLQELDQLARALISPADQLLLANKNDPDWLTNNQVDSRKFAPGKLLLDALGTDFSLLSVGIELHGACEYNNNQQQNGQLSLKLNKKIGKLNWALGEPIEYSIPQDTFTLTNFQNSSLSNKKQFLKLSLHTIDGLTLDRDSRYSFLEFDTNEQIIYGLAYDQHLHSGQRELQLTAEDTRSGELIREIFIINVEPQDLTVRGNRAFRMSLYLVARTNSFGPKERVCLTRKIIAPFRATANNNQQLSRSLGDGIQIHDFVSLNVLKFALDATTSSSNLKFSNLLNYAHAQASNNSTSISEENIKIVRLSDEDSNDQSVDTLQIIQDSSSAPSSASSSGSQSSLLINRDDQANFLYKFVWTNETIGYQGDCPVEVIHQAILNRLELFMWDQPQQATNSNSISGADEEDASSAVGGSGQARFYDKLRHYFEPDINLVHLRFEPLGACLNALQLHDVGQSDIADLIDRESEDQNTQQQQQHERDVYETYNASATAPIQPNRLAKLNEHYQQFTHKPNRSSATLGEYWLVLILLVALLFVIVVFALGMYTYKVNQDKNFELQVRLAQARQNSMYLSSMVLANQLDPSEISSAAHLTKSLGEEQITRNPRLLDSEKAQLNSVKGAYYQRSSAVHLTDANGSIKTMAGPIIGSSADHQGLISVQGAPILLASWPTQDGVGQQAAVTSSLLGNSPSMSLVPAGSLVARQAENYASMTLHRRLNNSKAQDKASGFNYYQQQQQQQQQQNGLNLMHSQSILTIASMGQNMNAQQQVPLNVYGSRPAIVQANHSDFHQQLLPNGMSFEQTMQMSDIDANQSADLRPPIPLSKAATNGTSLGAPTSKLIQNQSARSPSSYSSSTTSNSMATTTPQSVISNPNYRPKAHTNGVNLELL